MNPARGGSGFRGWRVVGGAAGIQFLQAALMHQSFGAYIALLGAEKGWSKTSLSGAAALQSAESALLGPVIGWIVDRFGARGMVRAGILVFGLGMMALSQVQTIGALYAVVLLIALGTSGGGYFPLTVAVVQWFNKQRARALSAMSMGMAAGGMMVPLVAWSMQTWGWRHAALGSGLIIILVGWPLASLIHSKPEDVGETPDGLPREGAPAATESVAAATGTATPAGASVAAGADTHAAAPASTTLPAAAVQREFTAREALRTQAFWMIGLGHALALLVVTSVNVHAITHMHESLGYSVAKASLFITLMTVAQAAGVAIGLWIDDRYDKRHVSASTMLMHGGGLLMLTYATGPAMLATFAIVHGIGWGLRGPFMQAIRAEYFGRNAIGLIMGLSTLVLALGQIGGPMIAGMLADATGNYRVGFTSIALMAVLGAVFFLMARKPV